MEPKTSPNIHSSLEKEEQRWRHYISTQSELKSTQNETVKLVEENIKGELHDVDLGNDFFEKFSEKIRKRSSM